jgi:hypothetical protein
MVVKEAVRKLEIEQVFDHLPDAGRRGASTAADKDLQAGLVAGLGGVPHRPALGRDAERHDGHVDRLFLEGFHHFGGAVHHGGFGFKPRLTEPHYPMN